MLDSFLKDFSYALRRLRHSPGFTGAAVACLSLGVWLACVVTAVSRGVYRPELGFSDPDRMVQVEVTGEFGDFGYTGGYPSRFASRTVFEGLLASHLFTAIGEYQGSAQRLADETGGRSVTRLSSGIFGATGARPILGRAFVPDEDIPGGGNVAVLSYDLWQQKFGGDSAVLGRRLRFSEGPPLTIVGVMPSDFRFPFPGSSLYIAAGSDISRVPYYGTVRTVLGRLRDGVTIESVETAARDFAVRNMFADRAALVHDYAAHGMHTPIPDGPIAARALPYHTEPIDERESQLMTLVIACGLAVVLIACANVANLLLVRGAARRREIAVRIALGASRGRVVRQMIIEGLVLSISGAVLGLLLALWHWQLIDSSFTYRHIFGAIDRHVAMTAGALGVGLVGVFALMPALRSSSLNLEQVLRDEHRSGMGGSRLDGLLTQLIIGSTAGTVVLLSCATLLGVSARDRFAHRTVNTENVLAADISFDREAPNGALGRQAASVLDEWAERTRARAVAIAPSIEFGRFARVRATLENGKTVTLVAATRPVTGNYFAILRIPILAGRSFAAEENQGAAVAMVDSGTARRLWPGQTAIGRVVRFQMDNDTVGIKATIIGVAAPVSRRSDHLDAEIYFPFGSMPSRTTTVLARFDNAEQMRRAALQRPPHVEGGPFTGEVLPMEERTKRTDIGRYVYIGFALFATAGLLLVTVGLYGVIAFSAARREHEIGVRLALGATSRNVEWMVTRQGLKMTLIGAAIGLVLSFAATQMLRAMVPNVSATDPRILGIVIGVVVTVSIVACYLPARRAGRLDAMNALRAD